MKSKWIILTVLLVLSSGCSVPKYVPRPDDLGINTYGSYIQVFNGRTLLVKGELIAVENDQVIVLGGELQNCMVVPRDEFTHFKLQYADQNKYGWTIPAYLLSTLTHGWLLILTAPANLILTIGVNVSAQRSFSYDSDQLPYRHLKMFARYPQGIPENIDISEIQ